MFRFVARGVARFRLGTALAAMLLCISFAGWFRDRRDDAKEQAALDALAKANVGFRIARRSENFGQYVDSKPGLGPRESPDAWFSGEADPIVSLIIEQIPPDAIRRQVLDLPHLERLRIRGYVTRAEGESFAASAPLEETVGRKLPDLPSAMKMPDEPPPLPRGTPLSDKERATLLRAIDDAWHDAAMKPWPEHVLRYAESDDPREPDIVVARRGSAAFRLERQDDEVWRRVSSRLWIIGEERRSAVQRRWEAGEWRLEFAARTLEEGRPLGALEEPFPAERTEFESPSLGTDFVDEDDVDAGDFADAERLDDGGYALRRRPRGAVTVASSRDTLEESWVIVGPAPNYLVKRCDVTIGDLDRPARFRRTDLYETEDETALLVRRSTWIRETWEGTGDGPRAPLTIRKQQVRYAYELGPELPDDLFDPARQGEEFFTSEPLPPFRWWYVTGLLSLAAFAGIGVANVYGLAKRCSARVENE